MKPDLTLELGQKARLSCFSGNLSASNHHKTMKAKMSRHGTPLMRLNRTLLGCHWLHLLYWCSLDTWLFHTQLPQWPAHFSIRKAQILYLIPELFAQQINRRPEAGVNVTKHRGDQESWCHWILWIKFFRMSMRDPSQICVPNESDVVRQPKKKECQHQRQDDYDSPPPPPLEVFVFAKERWQEIRA